MKGFEGQLTANWHKRQQAIQAQRGLETVPDLKQAKMDREAGLENGIEVLAEVSSGQSGLAEREGEFHGIQAVPIIKSSVLVQNLFSHRESTDNQADTDYKDLMSQDPARLCELYDRVKQELATQLTKKHL